jgi:hypothetical protein
MKHEAVPPSYLSVKEVRWRSPDLYDPDQELVRLIARYVLR